MTTHINIKSIPPRIRYVSNGEMTTYAFPFAIFKDEDLKVYFDTALQPQASYTVSGASETNGGSVTLSAAPENGTIITLARELSIERTTDFQEGSALRADTLNHELDYQIACQQQIADNLNRSMVLPPYAAETNINLTLPLPAAGKAIVWNAQGTNLENSNIEINAYEETIRAYKTQALDAATTASEKALAATEAAQTATAKAQQAVTTLASKANKDFTNVDETNARKLIGNRLWTSGEYELSAAANTFITHNLSLSDVTKALAIPYLKVVTATNGYEVGDIIYNFGFDSVHYTPYDTLTASTDAGKFLNLTANNVMIPRCQQSKLLLIDKNSGVCVIAPIANFKIFVKIMY